MTALNGWPAVSGAATFQDIRRSLAGTVAKSAAGVLRKGILPINTTNLLSGTATMVINVATHVAVLDRNGAVFMPNEGVTPVTLSSAPGSGSRWSVIFDKQRETDAPFADAVNGPQIDKVESTTSLAAARALLPAGALEIGYAQVNAGSANTLAGGVTITETVPYTAMAGGVVNVRNSTELDAWVPIEGSLAWLMDSAVMMVRKSGGWALSAPIDARNTHVGVGGVANGTALLSIVFPALPVATIVDIEALAQVGNTSGSNGTYVPSFSTIGGTISELAMVLYGPIASGAWVHVSKDARLTLPANTAATVTIAASSTQNGQWILSAKSSRRSA